MQGKKGKKVQSLKYKNKHPNLSVNYFGNMWFKFGCRTGS